MGIPENSIKQYKIGEKQIVVGNNDRNVELDNLHIVEEFDAFTDPYDKNGDFRISTKSYASIFMNDINELIGNDNEITDAEIEAYIEKKNGYYTIDDVKNALIDIFSLKKSPKFQEIKNANGEIVNEDIRTIKIGDKKIYIGNEITESIDISKYCSKGYCDNDFLSQFVNKETKQIDFEIEATKLYELIDRLSINGEITDEAIENYINETPSLKNYNPKWIKEFLIQAFPPPKTEEEKQQYFAANEARIKKITGVSNLMNEKTTDELVNIAKDIVTKFHDEYGELQSPSMRMIIEKEYYRSDSELTGKIYNIRCSNRELSELVKEYKVANCSEDATLTKELLKKNYPDIMPIDIEFISQDALSDTCHVAVLIVPKSEEEKFMEYGIQELNKGDSLEKFQNGYVIDNWFGGVYRADKWIEMQKVLHKIEDVQVTTFAQ